MKMMKEIKIKEFIPTVFRIPLLSILKKQKDRNYPTSA
jgi:hypothetical protein